MQVWYHAEDNTMFRTKEECEQYEAKQREKILFITHRIGYPQDILDDGIESGQYVVFYPSNDDDTKLLSNVLELSVEAFNRTDPHVIEMLGGGFSLESDGEHFDMPDYCFDLGSLSDFVADIMQCTTQFWNKMKVWS